MLTVLAILGLSSAPWLAARLLDGIRHRRMRSVHARLGRLGRLQIPDRVEADHHDDCCPCVACVHLRWQRKISRNGNTENPSASLSRNLDAEQAWIAFRRLDPINRVNSPGDLTVTASQMAHLIVW